MCQLSKVNGEGSMSGSEVIVNEHALADVARIIKLYVVKYRETIENAIKNINKYNSEWSDEDFISLVATMNSFLLDVAEMENITNQLVERINTKINQVHSLHNMKIF